MPTGKVFVPPTGVVDRVAIMMAVGNNGGAWATHYTDHQKNLWRWRAAQVIAQVAALLEAGQQTSEP